MVYTVIVKTSAHALFSAGAAIESLWVVNVSKSSLIAQTSEKKALNGVSNIFTISVLFG